MTCNRMVVLIIRWGRIKSFQLRYTFRFHGGSFMRRSYAIFFAFLFLMPVIAQDQPKEKRPFTFEDMMKLKRVGEPEVSPDGKWVIFSVVDVELAANTKTPHIWIVPTAGGQEREIISDQDADRPRWAPDGKRFAFISTKEGGSQVWIADFDEATGAVKGVHRLTSVVTEASGELWSPDGKHILYTSDVYPECLGDIACNAEKLKEAQESKVRALIFDRLLYRHWNAYKEGKRSHILLAAVDVCGETEGPGCAAGVSRDLTPGDYDAPVFSVGGQDNYAFSPDGQEICYTSNHDKNPAASTNNDLWIVSIHGGEAKNITADNPASDSTPLYSPDGKYIAYRAQQRPGYEADRFRLMVYDRKTGEKKNLTEDFDRWVGTFAWNPNSKLIYFASETIGGQPLLSVELDSGVIAFVQPTNPGNDDKPGIAQRKIPMVVEDYYDDIVLTSDGTTLLCTQMSLEAPIEIHKIVLRKETEEPLTHFNQSLLSQITMSPLESFWFTGTHGDKVQGFLVKPPHFNPDKKYPL